MSNKIKNIVTTFAFVCFIALFVVLCAVRAANPRHYTKLLPTLRALPRYPIRMDEPCAHHPHRIAGIACPID